jgi:hypothetical protein
MTKAKVQDWQAVQYFVVPDDLLLGKRGRCLTMAGMRSWTVIDEGGLWFGGTDGTSEYASVKVDRHGLNRLVKTDNET